MSGHRKGGRRDVQGLRPKWCTVMESTIQSELPTGIAINAAEINLDAG